ncbi:MAG: thiamine pyrophosphate-binding protein, partial [Christensenella sp.]
MKIRLADYVADFLVENGISDVFTVVGGGAMHLNDALGKNKGLHCVYNHHEQACAIA